MVDFECCMMSQGERIRGLGGGEAGLGAEPGEGFVDALLEGDLAGEILWEGWVRSVEPEVLKLTDLQT